MGVLANHDVVIETELAKITVPDSVIREGGWIREGEEEHYCHEQHCDDDTCECILAADAIAVVSEWHNRSHSYAFSFCDESPCRELRNADL